MADLEDSGAFSIEVDEASSAGDTTSTAASATTAASLETLLKDRRKLSTASRGSGKAAGPKFCRIDGRPVAPHKRFCAEHDRAQECIKRQAMRGCKNDELTEEGNMYLGLSECGRMISVFGLNRLQHRALICFS